MEKRVILTAGDVLRIEFLKPMGLSNYKLAKEINVSPTLIGKIVNGRQGISVDMALRLSMFFGNTPRFWLNLQNICELEKTKEVFKFKKIVITPHEHFTPKTPLQNKKHVL
ncbi:MAG: HigA family addiction module antidote protein [Rickettsiales bacterium]|jgi:addiction module HigA family antidote|nr:HigA family addiction module antidote protein [Rickettsiales bacterium]